MKISLSILTFVVALALSAVAAYYSIIGLTAIFAGAVIPVIVMGAILEVAKLTTTVWLRKYWDRCKWALKTYLVSSVIALALLTSLGIFGFLSRAHIEQGATGGDVAATVALIDEKIKTQRENIKSSREALAQMDLQVNNVITKGDTEKSAVRSVQIRRQQAKERGVIQKEIETANTTIGKLNEERAPVASQLRKVESEVGPIKYVAAMIYGDNPDQNLLEKAVRWVIILLVLVFDPLAVALLLAANQSREWDKSEPVVILPEEDEPEEGPVEVGVPDPLYEPDEGPLTTNQVDQIKAKVALFTEPLGQPYENVLHDNLWDLYESTATEQPTDAPTEQPTDAPTEQPTDAPTEQPILTEVSLPEPVIQNAPAAYQELANGYVAYQGKHMAKQALQSLRPDLFLLPDNVRAPLTNFGVAFPAGAVTGDTFVRVDVLPNNVFKFDGGKWIKVNKEQSTVYLTNQDYIKHLVHKIDTREYDVDLLTEHERLQIEEFLKTKE